LCEVNNNCGNNSASRVYDAAVVFGRNVSEEIRAGRVTGEETRSGSRTSTSTFESLYEAALNT